MKTFKLSRLLYLAGLLAFLLTVSTCKDNSTAPGIDDTGQSIDNGTPINPPPSDNFKIISDDVTETDNGYRFSGELVGINGEGIEFSIGEGEFEVELDVNGMIISISGTGLPEFPDIGLYAEMLEEFAWSKIESHIEYETGNYFIDKYNTDIPLTPDRHYLHFRVFDESKDGQFELRGIANNVIYNFYDMYIDINDPALFFKIQLWKPSSGNNADEVAQKFWKLVSDRLVSLGKSALEFPGSTNMIVGLSKQGTFITPEYELGMKNSDAFSQLYGYNHLDSFNSNIFFALSGIPIPKTYILQLNGHLYSHQPYQQLLDDMESVESAIDWFLEGGFYPRTDSYFGSIDFGGKGLAFILLGVLPTINDLVGYDIFNEEIDIHLIEAFMQERKPDAEDNGFFRISGEVKTPVITDLFGWEVNQYLEGMEQTSANGFLYFGIESELDESSIYLEQSYRVNVPHNPIDAYDSIFLINKDGITFKNSTISSIGILEITQDITGEIHKDGFDLQTTLERDISLQDGLTLYNRGLALYLSSHSGASVTGTIELPFDLGNANVSGEVTSDGLTINGEIGNSLVYHGHSFSISNSSINVEINSNVTSAFNIALTNTFNPRVNGEIIQSGYTFSGSNNFSRGVSWQGTSATMSGTVNTNLSQNGISLAASGRVTYTGLLGNTVEAWSGSFSVQPNWTNKTIRVCTTGSVEVCAQL